MIRLCAFTGILLLISNTEERCKQIEEKIYAIDAGVDEYLGYSQSEEEIIASVKALLRLFQWRGEYKLTISGKQFMVNPQSRRIFMDGTELVFTRIEFDILKYLILNLNRVVPYKELYEAVWEKRWGMI